MQVVHPQILVGLNNGSFYALLSRALAVIFGMLNTINFAQGPLYMKGAFVAYFIPEYARLSYCGAIEPAARRKSPRNAG